MKILLVDAICGIGFPSMLLAEEATKVGLATYTGNQHNWSWAWHRDRLLACDLDKLQALYQGLREAREENQRPAEPESVIIHAH